MKPLVTVYITTYNRLELLKRAIESVTAQSYQRLEIIVADDGSRDGTLDFLADMSEQGILSFYHNSDNKPKGACYGRNIAIRRARGEFVTGLDDDDYFEPWRVETFVETWIRDVQNVSNSNIVFLFDGGKRIDGEHFINNDRLPVVDLSLLRVFNEVGNQVFTTKQRWLECGLFDEAMPAWQDWDTWLRMLDGNKLAKNIQSLSYVVDHESANTRISRKGEQKIREAYFKLSRKLSPLTFKERVGLLRSLYFYPQVSPRWREGGMLVLGGERYLFQKKLQQKSKQKSN